jgi:hypothetical protein
MKPKAGGVVNVCIFEKCPPAAVSLFNVQVHVILRRHRDHAIVPIGYKMI